VTNSHPLDPLTADEIRQAATILRRERTIGDGWRFASIELSEPAKAVLAELEASGQRAGREAIVVCWDRADGQACRATVSLTGDKVTSWENLPGQQPNMTVDEWHECDEMLRAHPAVIEALARRGITDMSLVLTDMWAYGAALVPERYQNRRIGWSDVWYRGSELGSPYAHHVTGLHPVVDLNAMTLLDLEDSDPGDRSPDVMGEYLPSLLPMRLREVTPLEITQPEGVGFTLDGHLLSWQNWQLRLGFNHREGLVLHQVAIRDGQRLRSVAHRLSFAEMVVPYRDASPDHYRRTAFDIGEWGLGFMTTSLTLGCDCLGEITPGARPQNGTLVDQDTYAPFHQHFIVARLDLDVDGTGNTVYATDSVPAKAGDQDRYGLGLTVRSTPLRTEAEGKQDYDWGTQRGWKVVNDTMPNGLGTPVGYKLVPSAAFPPLLDPASPAYRRAEVIGHTLWVTPYREDERWPCGDFPVQSEHDSGLPIWTRADRPIENTDVVLWYVFGIHHITRPEDWPVMPSDIVSFWLKPFGFFDRNPALDVPPSHHPGP